MRHLTLIRHGLTEGNVRRWYYGALELPLCEAGAPLQPDAQSGVFRRLQAVLFLHADQRLQDRLHHRRRNADRL